MNIIFVPEAKDEFLDAIYYDEAREGLGRRFKDEADRCMLWMAEYWINRKQEG
jgi:hypothetical protein